MAAKAAIQANLWRAQKRPLAWVPVLAGTTVGGGASGCRPL